MKNPYIDYLKSRRVLICEFLQTAENVGNEKHASKLKYDLAVVDRYVGMTDITEDQKQIIEEWLVIK